MRQWMLFEMCFGTAANAISIVSIIIIIKIVGEISCEVYVFFQ